MIMKTLKIALIAMMVTVIIIALCGVATATAETNLTPRMSLVVGWELIDDYARFDCLDMEGNVWSFYGDKGDWKIGDVCNLLMYGDEVIDVYWEMTLTPVEMVELILKVF